MLPLRKRWHNAFKRTPEKEARLLWFASSPDAQSDEEKLRLATASIDTNNLTDDEIREHTRHSAENLLKGDPKQPFIADTDGNNSNNVQKAKELEAAKKEKENQEALTKETMRKKFETALKGARDTALKIDELKKRMQAPEMEENIKLYGDPALIERWNEDMRLLNRESFQCTQEKDFIEAMSLLWEGNLAPTEFFAKHQNYFAHLPYGFHELGNASLAAEVIQTDQLESELSEEEIANIGVPVTEFSKEKWLGLNHSSKLVTINKLLRNVQMDQFLNSKIGQYSEMEKALKKHETWVASVESQVKSIVIEVRAESEGPTGIGQMLASIRWASINDYMKGIGKYWNAIKSTWETRGDRISAGIARNIGRALKPFNAFPIYGEEVDTILGQQLDAKDGEEEEAMKKLLESNHFNWEQVFGDNGVFQEWIRNKNPNKIRGILAWAADKGFLYDIDENLDNHSHPIFGIPVADLCSDWKDDPKKIANYFTVLRGKNSSGREHERKHGKEMENDVENVPRFIRLVEHEMDEHNLWAAAGVCERAMERGLDGAVSAWLFTTIMAKLRQHPALRRNAPVAFFDIIGKMAMYNTAFTMGWAKRYRRELKQWAMSGDKNGPPDESILDKTAMKYFNEVEKAILEKDPSIKSRVQLNELTARILAGGIVEVGGKHINIFEKRFDEYRKMAKDTFASGANPHKEDPDFAIGDTEKTMLPDVTFKEILAVQSTNDFKEEKWVMPFLSNLISLETRLSKIPELSDAHENYCKEIRGKMDLNFSGYAKTDRVFRQLATMDASTGKPALASLVAHGLLSWESIKNTEPKTIDLARKQLKDNFPEYYYAHLAKDETVVEPAKEAAVKKSQSADQSRSLSS